MLSGFESTESVLKYQLNVLILEVRLAERSKAPDLSSGSRKGAWVRTPHLTVAFFFLFL
jgi:hypothetical protein